MNTHYTKDDVVELASSIFVNDINSQAVAAAGLETEDIAESSFYAAEVFFNKAAAYHRGELDKLMGSMHGYAESSAHEPEERRSAGDRRQAERRGAAEKGDPRQTSPEEDEAFARLEQALKDQFLAATLHSIFRHAEQKG